MVHSGDANEHSTSHLPVLVVTTDQLEQQLLEPLPVLTKKTAVLAHLVGPFWHGAVGGLGHKTERSLAADHEALDDLDGVVDREVHKRIQGVACGALDGKLAADE